MPPPRFRPRRLSRRRAINLKRTKGRARTSPVTPKKPKTRTPDPAEVGVEPGRKTPQRRNARQVALRTAEFGGKTLAVGGAVGVGGLGFKALTQGVGDAAGSVLRAATEPAEQRGTILDLAREGLLTPAILDALGGGPAQSGGDGRDQSSGGFSGLLLPVAVVAGGLGAVLLLRGRGR